MVATKHPQPKQRSRRDTKTSYKVSAHRHFSGWFALLHPLDFNSVTIFREITGDASVLNVPSHILYYTIHLPTLAADLPVHRKVITFILLTSIRMSRSLIFPSAPPNDITQRTVCLNIT